MAAVYASTNTAMTSTTVDTLDFFNGTGSTASVSMFDDTNFIVCTNGGTPPTMFSSSNQHSAPAPPVSGVDPRILNRYLSASDLLEEFITDLGPLGVRQGEVLNIPVELFINWLICKAAEEDGAKVDDVLMLPGKIDRTDRCKYCGCFVTMVQRRIGALFCDGEHYERYIARAAVAA